MQVEKQDKNLLSREELENKLATLTAGRAAEEIAFGQITTGASNDIEQATKLARAMITRYGMDSQEDFAFATEYRDTKAVLVVNRYPGDDAALCAGIASYQQLHDITLDKANAAGNAKFLLQGRDENAGIFWPQEETLRLGETEPSDLSDKSQRTVRQLEQGKCKCYSISEPFKAQTLTKK